MIALLQRVARAEVRVAGESIGRVGHGLLVFFCAERGDATDDCERLLGRVLRLRCFGDDAGRMNRSVQDVAGALLVVPQFTLAADTDGGHRPGFSRAAPPDEGRRLYEHFVELARRRHPEVACGRFAADMQVELVNDGPVTLWLRNPPARRAAASGAPAAEAENAPQVRRRVGTR